MGKSSRFLVRTTPVRAARCDRKRRRPMFRAVAGSGPGVPVEQVDAATAALLLELARDQLDLGEPASSQKQNQATRIGKRWL